MERQSPGIVNGYESNAGFLSWDSFENQLPSAFTLGGILLVASVFVPVGLAVVTEWSWASGLVLVGLGVVAMAVGLLGMYPQVRDQAPWISRIGILCATVAGVAAVGLIVLVGTAVTATVTLGTALPKPMGVFQVLALSMASGLSLGFVLFGVARVRTDGSSDTPGRLLIGGGVLPLVPVVGELLRIVIGLGPPLWVLFVALGVVALDALAVGYSLRSASTPAR
jgi:hypothetical protein